MQGPIVAYALNSLGGVSRRAVADSKNIVQLSVAHIVAARIHVSDTPVRNQCSAPLHKGPNLHNFFWADRNGFRHDEDLVFSGTQPTGFDLVSAYKVVLQRQVLNELGPAVSNGDAKTIVISAALEHPLTR